LMSAIDQLIEWYAESGAEAWNRDLWLYSRLGHVHLSDDFVLMARPVCREWTEEQILDPETMPLTGRANTWHIHLAIGDMARIIPIMPYPLKWASFQRNGRKLRFYNLNKILSHGIYTKNTEANSASRSH